MAAPGSTCNRAPWYTGLCRPVQYVSRADALSPPDLLLETCSQSRNHNPPSTGISEVSRASTKALGESTSQQKSEEPMTETRAKNGPGAHLTVTSGPASRGSKREGQASAGVWMDSRLGHYRALPPLLLPSSCLMKVSSALAKQSLLTRSK